MRNDYYTTTELIPLLHISSNTLYKYLEHPDFFPSRRIGSNATKQRYIIDKMPFFEWYFRMCKDGTLQKKFPFVNLDHETISQEYANYIEWKTINQEMQRREFVANKRPVYRRRDCYGI